VLADRRHTEILAQFAKLKTKLKTMSLDDAAHR
jgi:hypothetical protein